MLVEYCQFISLLYNKLILPLIIMEKCIPIYLEFNRSCINLTSVEHIKPWGQQFWADLIHFPVYPRFCTQADLIATLDVFSIRLKLGKLQDMNHNVLKSKQRVCSHMYQLHFHILHVFYLCLNAVQAALLLHGKILFIKLFISRVT